MNLKSMGYLSLILVSVANLAWAAPPNEKQPIARDPSLTPSRIVTPCRTDLSIERIAIVQTGNPNALRVTVSVVNLGPNSRFEAPAGLINVRLQTFQNVLGRQVPPVTQFSREDVTHVVRGPGLAFDFEIPAGPPTSTASQIVASLNVGPDGPPSACDANRTNDSLAVPSTRLLPWLLRPVGTLGINRGF